MSVQVPTADEFKDLAKRVEAVEAALAAAGSPEQPAPDRPTPVESGAGARAVVWADDFRSGVIDPKRWNVRNNSYASNEESVVTSRPKNVILGTDSLTLRALKEDYTIPGGTTTKKFTSAYLDSRGKASWTYGRFEMRAKLPTGDGTSKGMWPAFWMRPDDGKNGEIDIMEAIGNEPKTVHATLHHDYLPGSDPAHIKFQAKAFTVPFATADDFHVYALEWTPNAMIWYVDNVEYFRRDTTTTPWYAEVFRKPYHFRLNLQVGGSWAKTPDDTTVFPGDYIVDWIRVYAPLTRGAEEATS